MDEVTRAIEAQQGKERTAVWMVGEQLKDILCVSPELYGIVAEDLKADKQALQHCEQKIKAFADKHRTGPFACVTPLEAEEIIREHFGLPKAGEKREAVPEAPGFEEGPEDVNLEDFL